MTAISNTSVLSDTTGTVFFKKQINKCKCTVTSSKEKCNAGLKKKYEGSNWIRTGVKNWPEGVSANLMGAYLSENSWNRYNSALNSWAGFIKHMGKIFSWPFEKKLLSGYVGWAVNVKHLQPDTVRVYLSDLKLAHELRNKNTDAFDDFFLKKMLKGANHLKMYSDIKSKTKLVMSFQMLRILGHEIVKSDWTVEKIRFFGVPAAWLLGVQRSRQHLEGVLQRSPAVSAD